ncbi:MAG: glycosyltransferase, partial [Terrimicrobiaceae bacterium]
EAMESVLSQTISDWEILVVDDQSGPETKAVVDSVSDSRIRYLRTPKQSYAGGSRNLGVTRSVAKLVSFLDDDDLYLPDKLDQTCRAFSSDQGVGVVASPFDCGNYAVNANLNGDVYEKLISRFHAVPTSSLAFRKDIFVELGGFDPSLTHAEDIDLCIRASRVTKFATLEKTLVFHRQHDSPRLIQNYDRSAACFKIMIAKNFPAPRGGITAQGKRLLNNFTALACSNNALTAFLAGNRASAVRYSLAALCLEPACLKWAVHVLGYCFAPRAVVLARRDRALPTIRQ